MLILSCSANMTHKIEWRQSAQNWFIQKFDGIWMDLLCAWHLNWIAALALLIELIFDQFGTWCTHHGFDKYTCRFRGRLFHFLLTRLSTSSATDCIFNTVSHISYICNAYNSLCGCEKFIALWRNQVSTNTNRTQMTWKHNEGGRKNAFNAKGKLAKGEREKDERFNRKVFQAYVLSCVCVCIWLVEFDCR